MRKAADAPAKGAGNPPISESRWRFAERSIFGRGEGSTLHPPHGAFHVDAGIVGIYLDPRHSGGETGVGRAVPLHGGAGVVPALLPDAVPSPGCTAGLLRFLQQAQALNVPELFYPFKGHVCHADLLALVQKRRAPQQIHGHGQHLGAVDSQLFALRGAKAGHDRGWS